MRGATDPRRRWRACGAAVALLAFWAVAPAAPPPLDDGLYAYRTLSHDTLIGLSRRLLVDPALWRQLQRRNGIAEPTRIPIGTIIRIPREWLSQSAESASLTSIVGDVRSGGVAVRAGDVLAQGADLATAAGSYATLRLADGSVVTLNSGSRLRLEQLQRYQGTGERDTQLKLDAGSIETQVKPQGDAGRFRIRTPVAISAVRGTEFRRAVDESGALDRTEVTGGAVMVSGDKTGVLVPVGFGTISDRSEGPRAPVKLLPPPQLQALPSRLEDEEVGFSFAGVEGARGYRAQLATDGDFRQVVAERVASGPELGFGALPDGHYWLRVRSQDASGLQGPDAVHEFDRHRLPAPPRPGAPLDAARVTGPDVVFGWSAVPGAAGYRFELARDATFQQIVIERELAQSTQWRAEDVAPARYYWRVAALDGSGGQGRWSAPIAYEQMPAPVVLAPLVLTPTSIEAAWTGEPGQRFRAQLAHDGAFTRVVEDRQVEAPQAGFARRGAGTYFLRVQQIDADGFAAPFGAARQIRVPPPWWLALTPLVLLFPLL